MKTFLTILTLTVALFTSACNPIGQSDQGGLAANDLCDETHCDPQPQVAANDLCDETHCDPQPLA